MTQFDAIVIGAGQAGPSMADRLTTEGLKTAIIERSQFGGTCVNTGCIPTKTLVASARVAHMVRRASEFGVQTGPVEVDMKQVKARMDKVRGESKNGVTSWLQHMDRLTVIEGNASFDGPGRIVVNGEVLQADKIFINVGAHAGVPPIVGLSGVSYFTNENILEVDYLPDHLIIIGGSYIGLEFAQMYRRFGSRVTVVEMADRIIPREDEDVSQAIQQILENEGVRFRLGSKCIEVGQSGDQIQVGVSCDDDPDTVVGTHLLLATGRIPNTEGLALESAGIATTARGHIEVDDELRTSAAGVWALGEVNGRGAFTHTAYNDYEIVAANLFGQQRRLVTDRIECYGLFIDPPLGRAGMTEQAAREAGFNIRTGQRLMSRVGRAREFGETQGFMKVVVNAENDDILGAAILGLSGDEAIHGIVDAMTAKLPYTAIRDSVHIHPTVSELIPTVFGELKAN